MNTQASFVALQVSLYVVLIAIAILGYVALVRPYIRAQRLHTTLTQINDALPRLRTCFEQSALISSALLLEQADAVIATGALVANELAPAVPAPPTGSLEDLRHAMEKALVENLKGLSISALDGVLDAVEKQTCGSVLEFWQEAANHWRENPQHAVETAMQIARVTVDGSVVNIDGLLQHFAEFGELLRQQTASDISEKLHSAAAAGTVGPGSVDHTVHDMSGPHLDMAHGLHPDPHVHFFDIDPDASNLSDVDLDIDGLAGDLFDGVDPTMLLDGIPVITIVKSAFREIRLLTLDKTSATDSLKNLAIDVGSAMTGIAIGSQIGTLVLPGVGTLIGAALGGILGRMAGNHVKAIPCKEAVEAYQSAQGAFQLEFARSIETWYRAFDKATNDSRSRFIAMFSSPIPASRRPEANEITLRLMDAVATDYSKAADEIRAICSSPTPVPRDRWYHRLGGVAIEAIVRVRAKALGDARIEQMEEVVRKMRAVEENSGRLRFVASLPCSAQDTIKDSFTAACAKVDELVKRVFAEFQVWLGAARIAQAKAFMETADVIANQRRRHEEVVSRWECKLKALADDARRKCEKLGG
jgi:hypothetical protein